jgi:hypothetical protein
VYPFYDQLLFNWFLIFLSNEIYLCSEEGDDDVPTVKKLFATQEHFCKL